MKAERSNTISSRWPVAKLALHHTRRARLAGLCLGLALGARASATVTTVINTYPDWDGSVTESYLKVAQSFLAPADSTLASWKLTLAPIAVPTNVLFTIVPWNSTSGPSSGPLFSRQVSWPALGGDILVDNISLTLTPGSRYAAVVDLEGYSGKSVDFQFNQNSYAQGNASWFGGVNPGWLYLNSPYNTTFQAEFSVVPEPANLLGLGLAGAALLRPRLYSVVPARKGWFDSRLRMFWTVMRAISDRPSRVRNP
ncbi:MAG TPA: PEP-CTERM sorting domain-containing protein [Candidatus Binatia bacterium]|jgi:hypothetical protein|nr:PEP-CTERM sorting domain-containing protein [Candidatus Binatia bacterium]